MMPQVSTNGGPHLRTGVVIRVCYAWRPPLHRHKRARSTPVGQATHSQYAQPAEPLTRSPLTSTPVAGSQQRRRSGVLCDLDGVLFTGQEAIPGAAEALAWLKSRRIPVRFLTNTTTSTRAGIASTLQAMGIPVTASDIISPISLAADWLRQHVSDRPVALFVDPATLEEFEGLRLLGPDAEAGAYAVVVGDLGTGWHYGSLNRAFRLLMHPATAGGVSSTNESSSSSSAGSSGTDVAPGGHRHVTAHPLLISLGKSRYYRGADGLSLDCGPFAAALEFATGCPTIVLGKPDPAAFTQAAVALGVPLSEVVMVGDDVRSDVGGAQQAGLLGVLVRTGKYQPEDEEGVVQPDAVIDSIAALPEWWAAGAAAGGDGVGQQ